MERRDDPAKEIMISRRSLLALFGAATVSGQPLLASPRPPPFSTPLERLGYARLPTSAEVNEFMLRLAASDKRITIAVLGRSAGGRELLGLRISAGEFRQATSQRRSQKLAVMIVAGQHGQEPSGTEASLAIARDLLQGPLQRDLTHLNIMLVPMANPDGRDTDRRVNAAGVNVSTDFVMLGQPEARALAQALIDFSPDVVLDVHESAALKRKTFGAQGFLIDFHMQFDVANNPNVDRRIRQFSANQFLPSLIADAGRRGVAARHYVGEVTDINQSVTHAGLNVRNFRNYAAIRGSVSVLLENQLDPPGQYDTPRNIKARVHKQYVGINAVLEQAVEFRRKIRVIVDRARAPSAIRTRRTIAFDWRYETDPARPKILLPLRRLETGESLEKEFDYHSRIVPLDAGSVPRAYVVKDHKSVIAEILDRHGIHYRRLSSLDLPMADRGPKAEIVVSGTRGQTGGDRAGIPIAAGDLWVDAVQAGGLLVPLLLDGRSADSVYHFPPLSTPVHQ